MWISSKVKNPCWCFTTSDFWRTIIDFDPLREEVWTEKINNFQNYYTQIPTFFPIASFVLNVLDVFERASKNLWLVIMNIELSEKSALKCIQKYEG